jgi:hypothetical protein
MSRRFGTIAHFLSTAAILVALLTPSAGLMTIPIPDDEPDASTIAQIADTAHEGKRFTDDSSWAYAAVTSECGLLRKEPVVSELLLQKRGEVVARHIVSNDERGPPEA